MRSILVAPAALIAALLLALGGCVTYDVVQVPQRSADVYPLSHTLDRVSVAVDSIGDPRRARRYFGADLREAGILPVHLTVSNHGDERIVVEPADVVLHRGREVIDPLPVSRIAARVKDGYWWLSDETAGEIDRYLEESTFARAVVTRGETYDGVLFFDLREPEREYHYLNVTRLFGRGGPTLSVTVSTLGAGERIEFGPFPVSR